MFPRSINLNLKPKIKMKYFKSKICFALAAMGLCSFAFTASAQVTQTTLGAVTNLPAIVTATAGSNTTSYIDIQNNSGLGLSWQFNVSAGTSNAVLLLYPSIDKTNYDSAPWILIRNAAGTTAQCATTNWSAAQLRGYTSMKVGAMTNQNNGTLTNNGVLFSRPNS
jgi:hypothetical protein